MKKIILTTLFSTFIFADTINWYKAQIHPYAIFDGKYKNQGTSDLLIKKIIKTYPQYTHNVHKSNLARITYKMKKEALVCTTSMMKTEDRSEFMYFSKTYTLVFPLMLYINRNYYHEIEPLLEKDKSIDLEKLIQKKSFKLGVSKGRRYGSLVDSIIKDKINKKKLFYNFNENIAEGLFEMLKKNRINSTVFYPFEITYFKKVSNIDIDRYLMAIPIKGSKSISGRIGCSKTPASKDFMKLINKDINIFREYDSQNLEKWFDKKMIKHYEKEREEIFLKEG